MARIYFNSAARHAGIVSFKAPSRPLNVAILQMPDGSQIYGVQSIETYSDTNFEVSESEEKIIRQAYGEYILPKEP